LRFPRWRPRHFGKEIEQHSLDDSNTPLKPGEPAGRPEMGIPEDSGNLGLAGQITRPLRVWIWLEQLGQDLRYALRNLRRSPGFSSVAVLSLAVGIGATTAIFSVLQTFLFKQLPVQRPEQLVNFIEHQSPETIDVFAYEQFVRFRGLTDAFSEVSAICDLDRLNLDMDGPGGGSGPAWARVALVSDGYFAMLGVDAEVGRVLIPGDDLVPGASPLAVISDDYWQRRLGRSPDVLERKLSLNGTTYSIVGVSRAGFSGDWVGHPVDIWIPIMMQSQVMIERPGLVTNQTHNAALWLRVVGRCKPGVSAPQAQALARVVQQQFQREWVGDPAGTDARKRPFVESRRLDLEPAGRGYSPQRESYAQSLAVLSTFVGLVLLIASVNVASLLLSRALAREREMAVRLSLGARRGRLVRQLLTESVVLATVAGTLGLLFAAWAGNALASQVATVPVSLNSRVSFQVHISGLALAFTAAVCIFTGILFGLVPAFRGSRAAPATSLTGRFESSGSSGRFKLGKLLVSAQVALSFIVLIGAGLFVRTLRNLETRDLGFERTHLLLAWTAPGVTGSHGPALKELWHTISERLSSLPGVTSVGATNWGVLGGSVQYVVLPPLRVEGQTPMDTGILSARSFVTPRFFDTIGVPFLAGRDFTERDNETAPKVVIINETMASYYFGNESPIGKHVGFPWDTGTPTEVVGVVGDFNSDSPRDDPHKVGISYFPYRDTLATSRILSMCVALRTSTTSLSMASTVRHELHDIDPNLPILKIDTVDEQLYDILARDRVFATTASFFGVTVMLLACLGLYGVISYTVARRTNEIGIRMALGTTPGQVLSMVMRQSMSLVAGGITLGVLAALLVGRLISPMLFGVTASDPVTFVFATLLMLIVAALASYLPARRGSRVDPIVALRYG
jgi:predicted permease